MGTQTTGATPEQKIIVNDLRNSYREELKAVIPGSTRIIFIDCHYVSNPRNVRPTAEGKEPIALKFAGNPYATLDLSYAAAVVDGEQRPISTDKLRKAWEQLVTKRIQGNDYIIGDIAHTILDPIFISNRSIQLGFTGISRPVK